MNRSNKDNLVDPLMVRNLRKNESSREYINIAPFLKCIDFVNNESSNPMEDLGDFIGGLARFVATASLEGGILLDGFTKEDILYALFHLEDGLKRSTLVNM